MVGAGFLRSTLSFPNKPKKPIPSMGRLHIYLHEWLICMVNVGKYTIYRCYGIDFPVNSFQFRPLKNPKLEAFLLVREFYPTWFHSSRFRTFELMMLQSNRFFPNNRSNDSKKKQRHQKQRTETTQLGWWFQIFFLISTPMPMWGRIPWWLICFNSVETTH